MNTAIEIWLARLRAREDALNKARLHEAAGGALVNKPTRAQAKRGRISNIRQLRAEHRESMLNMSRPAGHRTLPRFPSERERVMFAAHVSRREAGWIRG